MSDFAFHILTDEKLRRALANPATLLQIAGQSVRSRKDPGRTPHAHHRRYTTAAHKLGVPRATLDVHADLTSSNTTCECNYHVSDLQKLLQDTSATYYTHPVFDGPHSRMPFHFGLSTAETERAFFIIWSLYHDLNVSTTTIAATGSEFISRPPATLHISSEPCHSSSAFIFRLLPHTNV